MSDVSEALEAIQSMEKTLSGYMDFDGMVGGVISRSLRLLGEAKELLKEPTRENIREAVARLQTCKDYYSPFGSQAAEMMNQVDLAIQKLQSL